MSRVRELPKVWKYKRKEYLDSEYLKMAKTFWDNKYGRGELGGVYMYTCSTPHVTFIKKVYV